MAVAHHLGFGRAAAEIWLVVLSAAAAAAMIYVGLVRRRERDALVVRGAADAAGIPAAVEPLLRIAADSTRARASAPEPGVGGPVA